MLYHLLLAFSGALVLVSLWAGVRLLDGTGDGAGGGEENCAERPVGCGLCASARTCQIGRKSV